MAKTNPKGKGKKQLPEGVIIADGEELYLRNRVVASILAWIVPGAGHYYQQRYFKSAIFSISIFSTFLIGMIIGGNRCVYASWNGVEKRWQFFLQAGIGLPAIPAVLQSYTGGDGNTPIFGKGFMVGPKSTKDLDDWHKDTASGFDMGTLYTMIAGLLNILVIYDAYAGPLPPPTPKPKRGSKDKSGPESENKS